MFDMHIGTYKGSGKWTSASECKLSMLLRSYALEGPALK
jgi:hypothetical protein